jgi:RHS repeat-associated protein
LIILFCRLQLLTTIFLTLIFLIGGDFAVAKNQASSASLGDLCALAVNLSSSRTTTGPITQIIPSQSQSFTVNDRLTTDTYDANGNTTSSLITDHGSLGTNASDVYSFDNKLIRRTTPDGKTIDLTYTPDGHRLSKFITQNGLTQRLVHYLTDANNPTGYAQVIEERHPLDTASPLKKVNLYGHDLIATESRSVGVSPTSSIYYSYDGLGSVRSITNETGDLQETYDYDAYGTLIGLNKRNPTTGLLESSNLSSTIPDLRSEYLFTGEQWDADLGMYFLRARYLNTNTGRFHTQDSYEGHNGEPLTLHKYLYANGNPASYTDPSGMYTQQQGYDVESLVRNEYRIGHPASDFNDGGISRMGEKITKAFGGVYFLKPDILDHTRERWMEVKPFTLSGISSSAVQYSIYKIGFGAFGYKPDEDWAPSGNKVIDSSGKPYFVFNVGGILYYTDIEENLKEVAELGIIALNEVEFAALSRIALVSGSRIIQGFRLSAAATTMEIESQSVLDNLVISNATLAGFAL